jgi:hypothetical protein
MNGFCKDENDIRVPKSRKYLDHLNNHKLLEEDPLPWESEGVAAHTVTLSMSKRSRIN